MLVVLLRVKTQVYAPSSTHSHKAFSIPAVNLLYRTLGVTIESLSPIMLFMSVLLPTLGLPTMVT